VTPRLRALTVAAAAGLALVAAGVARPATGPVVALARAIVIVVPIAHADGPRGDVLLVPLAQAPLHIAWHRSRSIGEPFAGRLVGGVQLPALGPHFVTFDSALRRSPSRGWRRWGTARLIRTLLRVSDAYAAAHPHAQPVVIGDLSRPHGGFFGSEYGGLGHVSHQSGLDADVYYPRTDRRLRPPVTPAQIDHRLAQDLVTRFVRAGAQFVFVGPHTRLRGPAGVVEILALHDDHMHVRIRWP
jgi:murein endopeptidase